MNTFFTSVLLAAICGGALSLIAQLLIDLTGLTPARILVGFVTLGVFIFSLGIWDPLLKIFGCGLSVPLLGFGATIGRGVLEAVNKEGFLGVFSGGLGAAAGGISLTIFLGLLFSLIFRSEVKKM